MVFFVDTCTDAITIRDMYQVLIAVTKTTVYRNHWREFRLLQLEQWQQLRCCLRSESESEALSSPFILLIERNRVLRYFCDNLLWTGIIGKTHQRVCHFVYDRESFSRVSINNNELIIIRD